MGLNLDIKNFEPGSDTKFKDLIDWLNESFQKISTSPIMLECRDEEGNLIWDEGNPVYESDVITESFGSTSNINYDRVNIEAADSWDVCDISNIIKENHRTALKLYSLCEICDFVQDVSTEIECVYRTTLYNSLTGEVLDEYDNGFKFSPESNSSYPNPTRPTIKTSYIVPYRILEKTRSGEITLAIKMSFAFGDTYSGYRSVTFNANFSVSVISPQMYSFENIKVTN